MTLFSNKITYVASCALDFGPSFSRSYIFSRLVWSCYRHSKCNAGNTAPLTSSKVISK